MGTTFLGRAEELGRLREQNWRPKAILATLYGRRRVGKTALIEEAYKHDAMWKFEGIEEGNTKIQIKLFLLQLGHYVGATQKLEAKDWSDAFLLMEHYIGEFEKKSDQRLVIFLDEFQWLCEMKTALVSKFKFFWDNYFSLHRQCVFVICGSISSFIVKKVVHSKALYGRIDLEIDLKPLSIRESGLFFKETPFAKQVLDMYMVFGGVPQYWHELNPSWGLIQNLNEYAFKSSGYFFKEFDRLFISHFAASDIYEKVLRTLSRQPLEPSRLVAACRASSGGVFSEKVKDLQLAGFIRKEIPIDKGLNAKTFRYSLSDEFLHFYFRFILPFSEEIISGNMSYQQVVAQRNFSQWQGYAFERLCKKHASLIADHLKFSGISFKSGSFFQRSTTEKAGCQIDLLFVRADKILTVCELKYSERLNFKKVTADFEKKCEVLASRFPNYGIQKVLLTKEKSQQKMGYFDHYLSAAEVFLA
jgi:AAA+ ATPase superfamily predicted ATPase